MRNLLVKSLFAVATLGLSFNIAATSVESTKKYEQNQEMKKESKKENEKKHEKKHKKGKCKQKHKHEHKHKHKKAKPHQKYYDQEYQNQDYQNSSGQGEVRNVEPRVPEDNSGKKMEMDEYR